MGVSNFFEEEPPRPGEPPSPASEDEYGNVVRFEEKRGRKKKEVELPQGWKAEWHIAETGTPLPNLFNVLVALRRYEHLRDVLAFDEMARLVSVKKNPPGMRLRRDCPRWIDDRDVIAIQEELQRLGLRRIAKATVQDAIDVRAAELPFHPVKDYLAGLEWDGTQRVRGWLGKYLGVEGNAYSDSIGEMFLIALVARAYQPGCKADYMLILEGPQGAQKSSACRVIAGEWFSDNLPDLSRGDAVRLSMHLRGKWLIEIAEMSSFNAAESHTLKEFLTQTEERYTPKYARNEVREPRQCLFIGSTNEGQYLKDATGGRRFWPVRVGIIDLEALAQDRDQLLAEAVHLYQEKRPWWPEREFESEHIAPEQASRMQEDVWSVAISEWLDGVGASSSGRQHHCTVTQIATDALLIPIGRVTKREQMRINQIMTTLRWKPGRTKHGRFFERPDPGENG
jgi:predicted P-loop ATPase